MSKVVSTHQTGTHPGQPLPTGYKGIPFIIGERGIAWGVLWGCVAIFLDHVTFRISNLNRNFCPETSLHEASAIMITAPTIVSMTKNMHILRNARVPSQCTVLVKTTSNGETAKNLFKWLMFHLPCWHRRSYTAAGNPAHVRIVTHAIRTTGNSQCLFGGFTVAFLVP